MNETWFLKDYRPLHSEFQIRCLILARSGGTLYGCYKQALREIASRINGLLQLPVQCNTVTQSMKHHLLDELERKCLDDTIRELAVFYAYAQLLKSILGELSNDRIAVMEEEYWMHRLRTSIARDYLAAGRLSEQTIELLHLMPIDVRRSILESITSPTARDALINWYLSYEAPIPIVSVDSLADSIREIRAYVYGCIDCDCGQFFTRLNQIE